MICSLCEARCCAVLYCVVQCNSILFACPSLSPASPSLGYPDALVCTLPHSMLYYLSHSTCDLCVALYCRLSPYCSTACDVLCCEVLYYHVLCCTMLHCIVLYCNPLYCTLSYCTVLHCTVSYYAPLYCTPLYCTILPSHTLSPFLV